MAAAAPGLDFRLTDVTAAAGIQFHHNSGAFGAKYLPETLGPGCAFLDYDGDGWLDILLVNGMDWPDHRRERTTLRLYRNNRNGTFTDVTERAGLAVEMYGMGVAIGDYNNDGFPDILVTAVGQNRLFQNNGRGRFIDVTEKAGLGGRSAFSTSALWFDFDRDGLLDLLVCNYVKWSPAHDVFCSVDGKRKSYCTPEAYHGETCWLFRNRGNGTFEDVTAKSGIFDTTSKSLGVALLDYDRDGWPDLLIANDTQPNKLYRNLRNGTFEDVAVRAGVAFSEDGKARAGMGVDAADFDNSGVEGIAITNFDNEMMALYRPAATASTRMRRRPRASARHRAPASASAARSWISIWTGISIWWPSTDTSMRPSATFTAMSDTRSRRTCSSTTARAVFATSPRRRAPAFASPKVARGLAYGDFDRDGVVDLLITTNQGPAYLYRNEQCPGTTGCGCA